MPTINPAGVYATRFEMLDDGTADFHVLVPAFLTDGTGAADRSEPYRPIWINVSFQALGGPIAGDTVLWLLLPAHAAYREVSMTRPKLRKLPSNSIFSRLIEVTRGDRGAIMLTQRFGALNGSEPLLRVDADTGHRLFESYFGVARGRPERLSGNFGANACTSARW